MSIKIIKLIETPGRVKSREDVLIAELEKFYNVDVKYSQIFIGTIMKRADADDDSKVTYKTDTSKQQMRDFVKGLEELPSLRLHEWYITNFSKKYDTHYFVHMGNSNYRHIFVHREYKAQLDSYSKKLFDPFCRRSRILFVDPFGNQLKTTVAQLNYFRWAMENGIIDHIKDNIADISKDMLSNQPEKKVRATRKGSAGAAGAGASGETAAAGGTTETTGTVTDAGEPGTTGTAGAGEIVEPEPAVKKTRKRKARHELSISAAKLVTKHNVKITVTFT